MLKKVIKDARTQGLKTGLGEPTNDNEVPGDRKWKAIITVRPEEARRWYVLLEYNKTEGKGERQTDRSCDSRDGGTEPLPNHDPAHSVRRTSVYLISYSSCSLISSWAFLLTRSSQEQCTGRSANAVSRSQSPTGTMQHRGGRRMNLEGHRENNQHNILPYPELYGI